MLSDQALDRILDAAFLALDECDTRSAIELAELVLEKAPQAAGAFVVIGAAEFERLRLAEAKASLKIALELDEDNADAHGWMGLVVERQGNAERAAKHFREATRLDRETWPKAFHLSEDHFQAEVEKALSGLPADFRKSLSNLAIVVEPIPTDEALEGDPPLPPTILGLHVGTPRPARGSTVVAGPNTIFLFQRNIERAATTREELVEQLTVTLLHEIGHYLGLDEDEVEARGLE